MKYLKIANKGEVEVNAFELIGASTKVGDDTKIGMFGSGMNYAIAWMLRNGMDFKVYAGENPIEFGIDEVSMRGNSFKRIAINGNPTSFTITMGKDWKPWQVIREIYCNALDESDVDMEQVDDVDPTEGETHFYLELTPDIKRVFDDWDNYFSDKREDLIAEIDGVKVFRGGADLIIYRKGIMCYHGKGVRCEYHYDFPDININESRLADQWEVGWVTRCFLQQKADETILKPLLKNIDGTFEFGLDWGSGRFSKKWGEVIGDKPVVEDELAGHYTDLIRTENPLVLPKSMVDELTHAFEEVSHVAGSVGQSGIREKKADDKQSYMLKKARAFFDECDYDITAPIKVCDFNRFGIIGMAHEGDIFLSDKAFKGMQQLVVTIIEEQEHINTGYGDNTREFQNHFIELYLEEKCKRFAYTL